MTYHKQENPHKAINRFMSLIPCRQGGDDSIFKVPKEKKMPAKNTILDKTENKGERKSFPNKS